MDSLDIPQKISKPFADDGVFNVIPVPSQISVTPGAASFSDGFPPLTRTPLASGGVPPSGADMNGILNAVTAVQKWQSAGGGFKFDATFAADIGGYPKGALLSNATGDGFWLNLIENNLVNPDTVGTGWAPLPTPAFIQKMSFSSAVGTGTANAILANFTPEIGSLPAAPEILKVMVRATASNTTATPTFAANATAAKTIVKIGNTPLNIGDIAGAGHWLEMTYDPTLDKWVLLNPGQGGLFTQNGAGTTTRTQQDELRDRVSVKQFGAPADGISSDDAAFAAAIATGARVIDARRLLLKITGTITIPSGVTLDLTGAKIYMPGTSGVRFSINAVSKANIIGPFEIYGDGSGVGTLLPIYISDATSFRIVAPNIESIPGTAIFRDGGTNTSSRADHGIIESPKIKSCYRGYEDQAGTGAEYAIISNPNISGCADFGLKTTAGNVLVIGGNIIDNNDGVVVAGGSNHAHGGFYGVNINHNTQWNLKATQVLNGETFEGCHFYANGVIGSSAIWLDRCKGISISGGHLDCQVYNYKDGSSGLNVIENMYCPGGYGVARLVGGNDGFDQLVIRGCYGPGSYAIAGGKDPTGIVINDPAGLCYAVAQRDAGSTQALTSGVTADLIWPAEPFPDRSNAYDTSTGIFIVPAGRAGQYRINFDAIFGGTAMNATASYVEIKVNGTSKKLYLPSIFGTTKLSIQGNFDMYLAVGDAVKVTATIVGTSPVFGDGTYASNYSINRIA